jgi:DNA end-binding protein Ku
MSTASISFGLVTVPVRVYAATETSAGVSFHLLHGKDGVRLRQQLVCPADGDVVPRRDAVKGYEFEKDRFVAFTREELKALDEEATRGIEIEEFVPLPTVDPAYFERTYYLSPDKGGDRAFALLARALGELQLAAVGQYAVRGKDYLVAVRPREGRLVMHQLLHADEIRPIDEIPAPEREARPAEMKLAMELVQKLTSDAFDPARYQDKVRARVRELIDRKVAGEPITTPATAPPKGQVVDLMAALKASLDRRAAGTAASTRPVGRTAAEKPKAAPRRAAAAGRRGGTSRTARAARKAS